MLRCNFEGDAQTSYPYIASVSWKIFFLFRKYDKGPWWWWDGVSWPGC